MPSLLAAEMQTLKGQGFVSIENNRISLSSKGLLFYDSVASAII